MLQLWQQILGGVKTMTNQFSLTPAQQQQLAKQQQFQQMAAMQNTTTTGVTYGSTAAGSSYGLPTQVYYGSTPMPPPIEKLVMCEPGWRYVRWRKTADDTEATAEVLPILSLACTEQSVSYILGEASPTTSPMTPYGVAHFLAVLAPGAEYDAAHWDAKAKAAWYDYHANEVAQRLLKSAAGV